MPHNVLKHAQALRVMGKYPEAISIVRNCLETCDRSDHGIRGELYAVLAKVYKDQGKRAEALEHYKEAYTTYREGALEDRAIHALRHIADVETELGILEEASRNYDKVLSYYHIHAGSSVDNANALRGHGVLMEKLNEHSEANQSWSRARKIYEAFDMAEGVSECDAHLSILQAYT